MIKVNVDALVRGNNANQNITNELQEKFKRINNLLGQIQSKDPSISANLSSAINFSEKALNDRATSAEELRKSSEKISSLVSGGNSSTSSSASTAKSNINDLKFDPIMEKDKRTGEVRIAGKEDIKDFKNEMSKKAAVANKDEIYDLKSDQLMEKDKRTGEVKPASENNNYDFKNDSVREGKTIPTSSYSDKQAELDAQHKGEQVYNEAYDKYRGYKKDFLASYSDEDYNGMVNWYNNPNNPDPITARKALSHEMLNLDAASNPNASLEDHVNSLVNEEMNRNLEYKHFYVEPRQKMKEAQNNSSSVISNSTGPMQKNNFNVRNNLMK